MQYIKPHTLYAYIGVHFFIYTAGCCLLFICIHIGVHFFEEKIKKKEGKEGVKVYTKPGLLSIHIGVHFFAYFAGSSAKLVCIR